MVNKYQSSEQAEASSPYGSGGTPVTRQEADAANVVGRQNREEKGLGSGYGGYSGQQLDTVNQERAQREQQNRQQEQDQLNYEQRARLNAGLRPGFTDPSQLGDTSTQRFREMNRILALSGMPTINDDAFTGAVLGAQYKMAVATPGTRDDQFFLNEIGKWNRNPIELSSSYHDVGMNAGVPIPANPFENRGDVALALEKGGNLKDFTPDRYGFNQNVGKELGLLPGGKGIQETQWEIAKTGRAADVDFRPAIEYQVSQTGKYGVYGNLAGGIPDKVDVPAPSREPIGNARLAVPGTLNTTPTGKDWNPFVVSAAEPIGFISEGWQVPKREEVPGTYIEPAKGNLFGYQIPLISPMLAFFEPESIKTVSKESLPESSVSTVTPLPDKVVSSYDPTTGETITTTIKTDQVDTTIIGGNQTIVSVVPGKSGYDKFNQNIRDALGLPEPKVGEAGMEFTAMGNLALPGAGPILIGQKIATGIGDRLGLDTTAAKESQKITNPFAGQYTQFYEQPVLVPLSYGAGAVFGAGAKGLQSVLGVGRTATAETIVSGSRIARGVEISSNFMMENAPKVLGAMYIGSIAERSTQGGTNLNPSEVVPRARGLVMQEAVPMGAGFNAPGQAYDVVRTTNIGYKAALQEGGTTGKFDYFVKQPVSKPFELAKIDRAAFKQENPESGFTDYIFSKTKTVEPEPQTLGRYAIDEFATTGAYGKSPTLAERFNRVTMQGTQSEPQTLGRYARPEFETTGVYKKGKGILSGEIKPEPQTLGGYPRSDIGLSQKAYPEASEPLGIKIKSYFQENQPFKNVKNNLIYPKAEIQKINQMSEFDRLYGGSDYSLGTSPKVVTPSTPTSGRVTATRVVGGRSVPALAKEPSLKSQGISGTATESIQPKMGQRTDFRNQRGAMKPMDRTQMKQGAIFMEPMEAPARAAPIERVSQPSSFNYNILQVQPQDQEQRSSVEVTPVFMTGQITGILQSQKTKPAQQSIQERARDQRFDTQMKRMQREGQEPMVSQRNRQGSSITPDVRTDIITDQSTKQTPDLIRITGQRTDQRITTDYKPWNDLITDKVTVPKPPIIPGLPILPGGSGSYGKKRRGRTFTEFFPMGILAGVQAGYGLKTPRMAKPKKGKVIPKSMLTKRKKK